MARMAPAIVETTGHGFATSSDDSSIVMFDLGTFKVLGKTHAAEDADAATPSDPSRIVLDPGHRATSEFHGME
jgi:hypothetical protein